MNTSPRTPIDFARQPASVQWEPMPPAAEGRVKGWVWFRPPHFPHGFGIRLADDVPYLDPVTQPLLTMRSLLAQAGIDSRTIFSWVVNGIPFEGMAGNNPLLDVPLPAPVAGLDPTVYVAMTAPPLLGMPPIAAGFSTAAIPARPPVLAGPIGPVGRGTSPAGKKLGRAATPAEQELLESMSVEWNASLGLENDLARQRKLVTDMLGKLKSLNRDLNTDERTYSSSQDKKDWQDARRWLRDCSAAMARCLKEFDIGFTSKAGQRTWFEETYEQYVVPRLPFEGLEKAHADFQMYHKSLQTLQSTMKSGLQHASQNGERRAQRILTAIAAKVRQGGNNQSFLGVVTGN